jgi:capsular polysaccharide biosynthesis protein
MGKPKDSAPKDSAMFLDMQESEAIFFFPSPQEVGFSLPVGLQVAKGEYFSSLVASRLDAQDRASFANARIMAYQLPSTILLKLSYFDEYPERSLRILQKAVEVFVERTREIVGADVARVVEPARLVGPVGPAPTPTVRERNSTIWIVLGLSLGLLGGIAIAILRTLISDLSKNPELLKKLRGELDS